MSGHGAAAGAGLLTLTVAYCALRGVLATPADILGSLTAPAIAIGCCTAALAYATWSGGRALRTYRYHIDPGGGPSKAIDHEVAHADKGAQLGGRCVKGRVFPDGSGWVDVLMPCRAPVEHDLAVDMAGARGEGENFYTSPHAAGDRRNAAARVAHLPAAEQRRAYREAERLAAPRLWVSGSAAAVRRALERTGSYR